MADRLAKVEGYLERHDRHNPHTHITEAESYALYMGIVDEQLPDQIILQSQIAILGCRVCNAVFSESIPGATHVGHNAVSTTVTKPLHN